MPNLKLVSNKKPEKYWIFVSIGIIINIFIFSFLSKQLEEKLLNDFATRFLEEDIAIPVFASEPE